LPKRCLAAGLLSFATYRRIVKIEDELKQKIDTAEFDEEKCNITECDRIASMWLSLAVVF
jgi:hypothetical protein